jgi:hypothetical protein
MAKTDRNPHQPLFPRLGQNNKRAFERPTSRNPLNKTALEKIIKNEQVRIKIEGENSHFHHIPITKTHKAFFCIKDLSKSIHTDQRGAFLFTSQRGNRYIMVVIHLDANYIFVKLMHSRLKEEMIRAYEKIINRMNAAGLGI